MNKVRLLTRLFLGSLFGINKYRYTKDPREKGRFRLMAVVWVLLIAMIFFYVGGLAYGLQLLGLGDLVPGYLTMLASLLIFVFGIFWAGDSLFSPRGYGLLVSLPLDAGDIAVARLLSLYAEDLLLTLTVMVPGLGVYGVLNTPGLSFYLLALVGAALIPAIPLVSSALLGIGVTAVSARMKHKSLVQTALMLLLVLGILAGSFLLGNGAEGFTAEMLTGLALLVEETMGSIYPPALWLGGALTGKGLGKFALYAVLSLGLLGIAAGLLRRFHQGIMGKLGSFSASHSYRLGTLESRNLGKSLFAREWKRYFSSSIYVTNTIIGPILGAVMAGALCFSGADRILESIPFDVTHLVPLAIGAVFTMMTTTACSISMEGKQLWLLQSLPIPAKALWDAKIALNLSLMAPFYLLTELFLILALKPGFLALLWMILLPGSLILFAVVLGITVNLKFPRFDWEKEEQVVKQGASAGLGGFAGLLAALILGAALLAVPAGFRDLTTGAGILALLALTVALYRHNNRAVLAAL